MLFHTWVFLVFFLIVYPVHLLLRRTRFMALWLIIASYIFYGWWNPWYLLLLFGTSAVDYLMVLLMERSRTQGGRRAWLIIEPGEQLRVPGLLQVLGVHHGEPERPARRGGALLQLPDPGRVSERPPGRPGRP